MAQAFQIFGALCVLAGFALAQFGLVKQHAWPYLIANALGSAILAIDAWRGSQWGFLLLEGVWALISLWGLIVLATGRGRGRAPATTDQ